MPKKRRGEGLEKKTFVQYDGYIDLHGFTIQNGYDHTLQIVGYSYLNKHQTVKVVTGNGEMHKEFPSWMTNPAFSKYVERFIPYQVGSWLIYLKQPK